MLGRNYRFSVNSQAGVNVTVTIKARRWKYASDGSISFESSEVTVFNQSGIASSATAWTNDSPIDNTATGLYVGADLLITVTPASSVTNSASTNVFVQVQRSTDGGTTWPDNGRGTPVAQVNLPTGSTATVFNARIR